MKLARTLVVLLTISAFAQQGVAPNGYYPREYMGSTFTGELIDGPIDFLTLRYKHGNKEEIFSGRFEAPCDAPLKNGKRAPMLAADVQLGAVVTAFYYGNRGKANEKTGTTKTIVFLRFDAVNGKPIADYKRVAVACHHQRDTVFKAFGPEGAATPEGAR